MEENISWMKKNAITANMWNLILAFAPIYYYRFHEKLVKMDDGCNEWRDLSN